MTEGAAENIHGAAAGDGPPRRPSACLRLSDEERIVAGDSHHINKFTEIDRDDELCGILDALHRLEDEIQRKGVSGPVRLEIEDSKDSFTPTSSKEVRFSIQSGC